MENKVTGKKNRFTYHDGELVMVKPLTRVGNSWAVILPREWIVMQGGVEAIKQVLLEQQDTRIIITASSEELEAGEL